MNSVLMATYVAGSLMSTATFSTMDECVDARLQAINSNSDDVKVVCVYKEDKERINPADFFKEFIELVGRLQQQMKEMQENGEAASSEETDIFDNDLPEYIKPSRKPFFCENSTLAVEPNKWVTLEHNQRTPTTCGS